MNLLSRAALLAASIVLVSSCVNEPEDPQVGDKQCIVSVLQQQSSVAEALEIIDAIAGESSDEDVVAEVMSVKEDCEAHLKSLSAGIGDVEGVVATLRLQKNAASLVGLLQAKGLCLDLAGQLSDNVKAWLGEPFEPYYETALFRGKSLAEAQVIAARLDQQYVDLDAFASDVQAGLREGVELEELSALSKKVNGNKSALDEYAEALDCMVADLEKECVKAISAMAESKGDYDAESLSKAAAQARAQMKSSAVTINDLMARIEACESELEDVKARLGDLEATVEELLGMIQSVTFVSDYSTDYAVAYYEMDLDEKVSEYGGKAKRTGKGAVELCYFVRPASAAKALNANYDAVEVFGYYANRISLSSVSSADYIPFTVDKIAVEDEARGLVTVTATPKLKDAFYYKEVGAKCAVSIKSGKTDLTSKFVEIVPKDNSTTVYVTDITPSMTYVEIDKGETYSLSATVAPSDAAVKTYSWKSSNENIVIVNQSTGLLTAVGVGEATVTATTHGVDEWGLPLTAECKVKVNEAFRLSGPPYVEIGYTADMFLDYPSSAIIESKVWKSSDPSKLTVDQNGKVTGVAHTYSTGAKEYYSLTVSCTINGVTTVSWPMFVAATQPKSIVTPTLPDGQTEISMRVDESISLASTINPTNVPEGAYKIRYQSDHDRFINYDTGVINEYNNTLTPTSAYVYITVDNHDQDKYMVVGALKKTVIVKVLPYYVKTISFDPVEMQLGQTVTLSPKFTSDVNGKAPTNTAVTWKSSNEAVATVDANGVVTSKAAGNVTITATATDGSNVSGTCAVSITQPWKSFELGDYVVRTTSGDIEFASELNAAKSKGTIVGVVVAKTNPRATDSMLPSTCTHGIAVALGEGEGKWWSGAPSSSPYKVYEWATQNGYQSTMGVDWSSSKGTHRAGTAELFVGYNNTQALKAFISTRGLSSEMISALNAYQGPQLPNGASSYYLPSVAEMDAIAAVSNMSWVLSDKLYAAGGTKFTNAAYWTVSDSGNSSSNAAKINPLTGALDGAGMKTNAAKFRYVFAF